MIFRVPEDFKGSFILSTLNKALHAGMDINITGNNLYAPDIKMAIKKNILIPIDGTKIENVPQYDHQAMIVNRTDKVLVLGKLVLKPWASLLIDKVMLDSNSIQTACNRGFIHIVSDEKSFKNNIPKKSFIKEDDVKKDIKKEKELTGKDRTVIPKIWDMRSKEIKEGGKVPKILDQPIKVEGFEEEDIDFIDKSLEEVKDIKKKVKKKVSKKKAKKKAKKKISKKDIPVTKKEEKIIKKRKVKIVQPVGEVKIPPTQVDASIELDSRGNPIKKVGDELQHMIDSLTDSDDIGFVDDEQAQEKRDQRDL